MDVKEILSMCDHTLLSSTATWDQVKEACDDGIRYGTATVCIPPSFVKQAKEYVGDRLRIGTVVGFPNGYSTTAVKVFEAEDAVHNGADEIDMVVNLGWVKEGKYGAILSEIDAIKEACGDRVLKVIIETCLLNEDEKLRMCCAVSDSKADYIKTSTGFSTGGATFEDVRYLRMCTSPFKKVKAAGGISSISDAERFIELGASRIGTSRIVKAVKAQEKKN